MQIVPYKLCDTGAHGGRPRSPTLTTLRVELGEVPEAVLAAVAAPALHVGLAVAAARLVAAQLVRPGVADAVVHRATRVAVTRCGRSSIFLRVLTLRFGGYSFRGKFRFGRVKFS